MIGVIADDVTGATDVAVALRRGGLRTVLYFATPPPGEISPEETGPSEYEAAVIALKTRTIEPSAAVAQSLAALDWLRRRGAGQIYLKFCSTFDSTSAGNIGPVLDALADALDVPMVAMTPSSPEHGRTQYQGYLFVGNVLLSESHMRDHPLTPMTDSYLPRVLAGQSAHRAGVVPLREVRDGPAAVQRRLAELRTESFRYALVDAVDQGDLATAGQALATEPLVAGAAGLAGGLAAATAGSETAPEADTVDMSGTAVVLAGSCSARTLAQLKAMIDAGRPAYRLDALADPDPESLAAGALDWFSGLPGGVGAPLIYSSLEPSRLRLVQQALGRERSATIMETAIGLVARTLVSRHGVTRVIAAGGETSGAVVKALGVTGGLIGAEAARGVPWIFAPGVTLLLKSGNFGEADLLLNASAQQPDSR
ncbi:3-oxo-tetronate kinase [Actinomadura fulvescens]|uniref:3-oxo-tetronate kinase n=1 Tax=Actinomadura fulvescens TaxID=46160 RepID=A0ABP6CFH3_9ACTN